ncbi:MAG: GNAT family N-acetyltransferase [Bacteroidia bacterium]
MSVKITISRATKRDLSGCLALINELAEYENAPHEVDLDLQQFEYDFDNKTFSAFVALDQNNNVLGMALYYQIYSTWKGTSIHLEDLVVKASERRKGIGKMLFDKVLKEAQNIKAGRLQWQVLDWNKPAIEFYKTYPAEFDREWINVKISKNQLQEK